MGVFEPQGRFEVVSTASGATLLTSAVDPVQWFDGIVVLPRLAGGYVLLVNCHESQTNVWDSASRGQLRVNGLAHGIDARGKKVWTTTVPAQHLELRPWGNLPVVFFHRMSFEAQPLPGGGFRHKTQGLVFCLDTRTGKVLHQGAGNDNTNTYELEIDPSRRIEFHSGLQSITLTWGAEGGKSGAGTGRNK